MTNFRLLFLVFCFCENNGISACGYLPEKTETAPPSFPRRRESRSVGAETYRVKRFLEILRLVFPLSWE
ncbi:pilS cassette [Neisseria meningitidis]|nr:pilS cassette [Neisseria meningitidis]MCG8964133.1 pilS cassette [Neisseria meningitidis]MCI3164219.1 pilS cassette [Neisseria meningitidis]TNL08089.1 pilS cassette [Neisseria meningitidis]